MLLTNTRRVGVRPDEVSADPESAEAARRPARGRLSAPEVPSPPGGGTTTARTSQTRDPATGSDPCMMRSLPTPTTDAALRRARQAVPPSPVVRARATSHRGSMPLREGDPIGAVARRDVTLVEVGVVKRGDAPGAAAQHRNDDDRRDHQDKRDGVWDPRVRVLLEADRVVDDVRGQQRQQRRIASVQRRRLARLSGSSAARWPCGDIPARKRERRASQGTGGQAKTCRGRELAGFAEDEQPEASASYRSTSSNSVHRAPIWYPDEAGDPAGRPQQLMSVLPSLITIQQTSGTISSDSWGSSILQGPTTMSKVSCRCSGVGQTRRISSPSIVSPQLGL